jgi:hypothetical protein
LIRAGRRRTMWVATEKPRECSKHSGARQSRRSSEATDCKGIISLRTSAEQTPTDTTAPIGRSCSPERACGRRGVSLRGRRIRRCPLRCPGSGVPYRE